MKTVFGVEWHSAQEDFDEAVEKLKALLKDGEESEIVYVGSQNERCHEALVKGEFQPNQKTWKFEPSIRVNTELIMKLGIRYDIKNKHLLTS